MSIKSVFTLLLHDIKMCFKSLLVFQLFLAPLSLWIILYLIFGQTAIGNPKVGLLEYENSSLVQPFFETSEVYLYPEEDANITRMVADEMDKGNVL